MKMTKQLLSVAAAAALLVTVMPTVEVQATPNVLATYDFESGITGMTDTGYGTAPTVVTDSERGQVLQFADGGTSTYLVGEADAGSQNSTKVEVGTPSSLKLDTNPFAGGSMTSGTIAMWVKAGSDAWEGTGYGLVGFMSAYDSDLSHPAAIYEDNDTTEKITGCFVYGITTAGCDDVLNTQMMVYFAGYLSNTLWLRDYDCSFEQYADQWVYMVVTLGNNFDDNQIYINGVQVDIQKGSQGSYAGKRFNHGELGDDNESNKHEKLMFEVLTASTTDAYVGFTGFTGTSSSVYIDDLTYYDAAATADEVAAMYQAALSGSTSTSSDSSSTDSSSTDSSSTDSSSTDSSSTDSSSSDSSSSSGSSSTTSSSSSSTSSTSSTSNLAQTGVVSTGVLVAGGAAAVAAGAVLFGKKKKKED